MAGCVAIGNVEETYVQGGGFPEGDYVWNDLTVQMHDGFGEKKSQPRLGVMITMANDEGTERQQFYSFGSAADKSFAPHESGKGIVRVPGGPKTTLQAGTNWYIMLQSLYDCGMPPETFINDFSVLDGIKVHMQSVDEPSERASIQSRTGDVETTRIPGKIAVVSEIKEAGWMEAEPAKPGPKAVAKPVAKAAAKKAPEPEPEPEVEEDETIRTAAQGGLATALEKCTKVGMAKATVRTQAAKAVLKMYDQDTMTAVTETYLTDDEKLTEVLAEIGFVVKGPMIKPIE